MVVNFSEITITISGPTGAGKSSLLALVFDALQDVSENISVDDDTPLLRPTVARHKLQSLNVRVRLKTKETKF